MKSLLALAALPALLAGGIPSVPLTAPRAVHTATLLPSGDVLVAGGCSVDSCELDARAATTELYDPETNRFRPGAPLATARIGHVAVRLRDGSVLVAGGWTESGVTATAEVYLPAERRFVPTGALRLARGGATATTLRDGRVLIVGGDGEASHFLRSAELYDPRTRTFTATGPLAVPRRAHAAVSLRDGRVLVVGGSNARGVLASTELYDPGRGRFVAGPRLVTARHKHAAVRLRGGSVLVLGGSGNRDYHGRYASTELWTPGGRAFRPAASMAIRRYKFPDSVALLPDGRVLVAGGDPRLQLYDPRRRAFSAAGRLDRELSFATATVLRDGRVLVSGGYDESIAVSRTAWIVTPSR
jgi:hypothetical protein